SAACNDWMTGFIFISCGWIADQFLSDAEMSHAEKNGLFRARNWQNLSSESGIIPLVFRSIASSLILRTTPMLFEIMCSVTCIFTIRAIANTYRRRRDVLYGPYITRAE